MLLLLLLPLVLLLLPLLPAGLCCRVLRMVVPLALRQAGLLAAAASVPVVMPRTNHRIQRGAVHAVLRHKVEQLSGSGPRMPAVGLVAHSAPAGTRCERAAAHAAGLATLHTGRRRRRRLRPRLPHPSAAAGHAVLRWAQRPGEVDGLLLGGTDPKRVNCKPGASTRNNHGSPPTTEAGLCTTSLVPAWVPACSREQGKSVVPAPLTDGMPGGRRCRRRLFLLCAWRWRRAVAARSDHRRVVHC